MYNYLIKMKYHPKRANNELGGEHQRDRRRIDSRGLLVGVHSTPTHALTHEPNRRPDVLQEGHPADVGGRGEQERRFVAPPDQRSTTAAATRPAEGPTRRYRRVLDRLTARAHWRLVLRPQSRFIRRRRRRAHMRLYCRHLRVSPRQGLETRSLD